MNKIEILAPAGGFDSVIAAVRSGADAVYIGAKSFSARASAHNFNTEELSECVRYCHRRGVKVHLALNTLIFDDEMSEALSLVKEAAKADIDALIVQDLGLVSLIKRVVPDLPLHASTQLSVHTPYGARALYEMGFERVVLSRELSLSEIKEIHDFCPEVELEVFVHGALCMCLSGQCYFSAMLGGRSANRGMCAQPCRLPMRLGSRERALSLKDNGSLSFLQKLQEIGVSSAKIEGRMKRPEYVASATVAAKEARDLGYVTEVSAERLRSVFSRTGFTDGYLRADLGSDMFGFRQKSDVLTADSKLYKEIHTLYKNEYQHVPLSLSLTAKVGEPMSLTASDGNFSVTVLSDKPVEKAINLPLSEERAAQSLSKTGGTPYMIDEISLDIAPDVAVSASALNALRRSALEKLGDLCEICHNYTVNEVNLTAVLSGGERTESFNRAIVKIFDKKLISEKMGDFDEIFVDIFALDDENSLSELLKNGVNIGVEVPRATFGIEAEIYKRLEKLRKIGAKSLLAHNISAVYIGKQLGFTVHAGFGMNIANSYTLMWAKGYGISTAELSFELDTKQVEHIYKSIPVGVFRYGHLPLMITRNVPSGDIGNFAPQAERIYAENGSKRQRSHKKVDSALSCKNTAFLQDRKNEKFPVIAREGYAEIYNCVPLILPQKDYSFGYKVFNVFLFTVENSVENMENTLEKLREYRGFERKTHGLYLRGVTKFTIS